MSQNPLNPEINDVFRVSCLPCHLARQKCEGLEVWLFSVQIAAWLSKLIKVVPVSWQSRFISRLRAGNIPTNSASYTVCSLGVPR